jgi:hypothetical protein
MQKNSRESHGFAARAENGGQSGDRRKKKELNGIGLHDM